MAKFILVVPTITFTAFADTTNFTNNAWSAIQGGTATQLVYCTEIFFGGQATASAPTYIQLARHSTVLATAALAAGASQEPNHPSTANLATMPLVATGATTQPQADVNAKLGSYAFNAFGGLVRKSWNFMEGPALLGNTASLGEMGLNAYTGSTSALLGHHWEYEPL